MLLQLIDKAVEEDEAQAPRRLHLGSSSIGRPCNRELWYTFRWAATPSQTHSGRMLRLFARGKREEAVFISYLERIGITVDRQQMKISDVEGHFGGSLDGVLSHIPNYEHTLEALLETKTANEKNFNQTKALGVQEAHPEYYAQMQSYMHGAKLYLALFMMVNKNTDELLAEWVPYNATVGQNLIDRARFIIYSKQPPLRVSNSPSWYQCRDCMFRRQCHWAEPMAKNCRTCKHSAPAADGQWACRRNHDAIIPVDFMIKGCDDYEVITD